MEQPLNKVLIIDDEKIVITILTENLAPFGYRVIHASTGAEGIAVAKAERPDLILLDVMLPDMRGWDVCRTLRHTQETADAVIIVISSISDTNNIVATIEFYNADDYVVKPFTPRILAAKVKAFLRLRKRSKPEHLDRIEVGPLLLDPTSYEAVLNGIDLELTKSEFDLLYLLAANQNRTLSRKEIITRIKGDGYAVIDKAVDVQISGIRKKLGEQADYIHTVRGVGFKFII